MSSSKEIAEKIVEKLAQSAPCDALGLSPFVRDAVKSEWRQLVAAEIDAHVEDLVVQSLRKRLPAVLEKVKDVWIDELKDKDLFSER